MSRRSGQGRGRGRGRGRGGRGSGGPPNDASEGIPESTTTLIHPNGSAEIRFRTTCKYSALSTDIVLILSQTMVK